MKTQTNKNELHR